MRFADVEQPERGGILRKSQFRQHRAHVIMPLHQFPGIEAGIQNGGGIQNGQRDHGARAIAKFAQDHGQVHAGQEGLELEVFESQARVEFQKFALVVFGRQYVARAGMRHESHEQVVVGWRCP